MYFFIAVLKDQTTTLLREIHRLLDPTFFTDRDFNEYAITLIPEDHAAELHKFNHNILIPFKSDVMAMYPATEAVQLLKIAEDLIVMHTGISAVHATSEFFNFQATVAEFDMLKQHLM